MKDPIPFTSALLARIAAIGVVNVFVVMAFVAAALFRELSDRAEEISQDCNTSPYLDHYSMNLEYWRHHYILVCRFVETINDFFGLILLIRISLDFAIPIFEFQRMFETNWQKPRFYFELGHTVIQFFVVMLVPSCAVTKEVIYLYNAYLIFQ